MSLARYHEHFASRPPTATVAGDASAWTLFSESAPAEIVSYSPEARIIVTLRSPAEMIHSIHGLLVYCCQENIEDFDTAVGAEAERSEGRNIPEPSRPCMALQYTHLGRYHSHIQRWIAVFGVERVHVVLLEDLRSNPAHEGAKLAAFLRLQTPVLPTSSSPRGRNAHRAYRSRRLQLWTQRQTNRAMADGVVPFSPHRRLTLGLINRLNGRYADRQPMNHRTRQNIGDTLRSEIEALGRLLDRDLSHWLSQ